MRSMSSLDISVVVEEISEKIQDARVDKIYHHIPDEIRIRLRGNERIDLVIEAGVRFHPTKFPKVSPRFPSSFAMLLRKHLENARIASVEQHSFDRVIVLSFEREEKKHVIGELFSKGNVILTDDDFRVIMPLKHRIKIGSVYSFPDPRPDPRKIKNSRELRNIICDREVVRGLALNLGTGGLYAEEILERAGVDKSKKCEELSDEEAERILIAIHEIYLPEEIKPHIVLDQGRFIDFQPVELLKYDKFDRKYFDTYWEAIDTFFSSKTVQKVQEIERKSETLERLKARYRNQIEAKKRFENEVKRLRRTGDLIYENYQRIEAIHSAFKKAVESRGWKDVAEIVEKEKKKGNLKEIIRLIPEENAIDVEIDGFMIRLWLRKSIHEIADEYYSKAKKFREKLEGVMKALRKTQEEMERAEELEERKLLSSVRVTRKREWYERYRWYITSEGYLVVGGRNAEMNEEIVSKHMEKYDLFFHTETPGGTVAILKNGQKAGKKSIAEACEFAAIYSALWREGKFSGEVYYVLPEQVKKAAKAGEYLQRGSFFIEGKRNYRRVSLKAAVGVDLKNLRLVGGPVDGVAEHSDYYAVLEIGDTDINGISVQVAKKLAEMAREDERHIVRGIATPDEVARFLPPGKSRISSLHSIQKQ